METELELRVDHGVLRCFGHVKRMDEYGVAKKVLIYTDYTSLFPQDIYRL